MLEDSKSLVEKEARDLSNLGRLIDTPDNISELSDEEIADLCDNFGIIPNAKSRVKFIRHFYTMLGYELSNDLLYALADEPKAMLMLAPAGGGKTTTVTAIIDICKMLRRSKYTSNKQFSGDRVLSLVFNAANVPDMVDRHNELTSKINRWNLSSIPELDYWLECRTFHGFCLKWIMEYRMFLGLDRYPNDKKEIIIKAEMQNNLLQRAIENICKKLGMTEIPNGLTPNNLLNVRNLCVETKKTLEDLKDTDKVVDIGIEVEHIQAILDAYDKTKSFSRRLDNTDLLTLFYKLVTTNEDALNRIKGSYDLITADEFQDFTLLLREILYMIVADDTQLICIGDDDQAIYGFRGADNDNALTFKDYFPNAKIHLLQTNRRCPSNVLDLAVNVIGSNKLRFPKKMHAIKDKGEIYFRPYNDRLGQFMNIVKELKTFSSTELRDCVISYREKTPSIIIANLLYEANIPFYVNSGYGPFDYPLLYNVLSVLRALQAFDDKNKLLDLYKVLPITRKELAEALQYDLVKKKFVDETAVISLDKIPFSPTKMNNPSFLKVYKYLIYVAQNMDNIPMKDYGSTIVTLVKKYYYNYVASKSNIDEFVYKFCTERCLKFFDSNFNFRELYAYYQKQRDELFKRQLQKDGVCLSTFHALKGLEFDSVFAVDLSESIFPKFSMIDFRPYDEMTKQELKESETRLFYVVVTRSKRRLYLYYNKYDPSYYITMLLHGRQGVEREEKKEENVINVQVPSSKSFASFTQTNSQSLTSRLLNNQSPNDKQEVAVTDLDKREEVVIDVNNSVDVNDSIDIDLDNDFNGNDFSDNDFNDLSNDGLSNDDLSSDNLSTTVFGKVPNEQTYTSNQSTVPDEFKVSEVLDNSSVIMNSETVTDTIKVSSSNSPNDNSSTTQSPNGSDDVVRITAKPMNFRDNLVNSLLKGNFRK